MTCFSEAIEEKSEDYLRLVGQEAGYRCDGFAIWPQFSKFLGVIFHLNFEYEVGIFDFDSFWWGVIFQ